MDRKLWFNIFAGFCIFIQFNFSLANVTDTNELYFTLIEDQQTEISTPFTSTGITPSIVVINATIEPSVVVTKSPKRKKKRPPKERSRRQEYGFSPIKYGLFDMCPPLATTCPECTYDGIQVPPDFCNLIVLKVLAISPPQKDDSGRVCGKFGMLKMYGDYNEKEFRRLLRFSVWETCGCTVKASNIYFLIAPLSSFLSDGLLYNQIVLSEQVILLSADRYIENEILGVLNSCPDPYVSVSSEMPPLYPPIPPSLAPHVLPSPAPYVPPPPAPYVPPPPAPNVPPSPAPYVPPPPAPYVLPPPAPYVPPPPAPYVPPPPAPYVPPPPAPYVPPPPAPYVPPPPSPVPPITQPPVPYIPLLTQPSVPYMPITPLPTKYTISRGKMPFLYPSLTKCLIADTCPICARLGNAGDITGQYCVAGFAYLAVIRVPDPSSLQGADTAYSGPTCMNLRTNIVYDITRTRDPQIVVSALTALLPVKCLECFAGLSGPVIVLIMGQIPPVPPAVQLDASFQVYILPVPSTIVLPSCDSYYTYGRAAVAYSLVPTAPQPYAVNDCPEAGDQTCPLCHKYPDSSFAQACTTGFAIVTELNLAGPYFTSQRLPAISVKTTTSYYSKYAEVLITNPPPLECIKGFFKIIQNIGLAPLNFPGEIIPFVSLPQCECLSQGFKRLLIFGPGPLITSQEGYLHLSKDINIAFLQPEDPMPSCSVPSPQPFYIPPHEVSASPPFSQYARPARVPLTYIPPPPPPPEYKPPNDPPPVYILPPNYIPPPIKESPFLPPSLYVLPQPSTLAPTVLPKIPLYTTELPFEETPPPIIGCLEFGNSSCVAVDANEKKETLISVNVDENIPFPPRFEALNTLFYESSSVWAPSFEECPSTDQRSCPHYLEKSPEKIEEFFCNAKTVLLVAVGIDYSILGNETHATKKLTFIQPELPYVGIDYGVPNDPVRVQVAVTRNKTMDRRIQLQDNADYCYKEKVLVVADFSNALKPHVVVGGLDVYIPGFCDSEAFDKAPSYGILLSLQQPSDVKNPVQLTEDFAFIPLPEGRFSLPFCDKLPVDEKPFTGVQMQSEKFWVPKHPLESVICELSEDYTCGSWKTVQDDLYSIPCDMKSAALVLVQNTSAGDSVGPNLEIIEHFYEPGAKEVILNVQLNVDGEDASSPPQKLYSDEFNRCKYATVRVLKDFSRQPLTKTDDVFTIIGATKCDNTIFKLVNEVVLVLSDELIFPNTVLPLDGHRTEAIGIPPGTTTISFCNAKLPYEETDDGVIILDESNTSSHNNLSSGESNIDTSPRSETSEILPNTGYHEILETQCRGHADNSCPVCEDFGSISSEVYCKAGVSLFAEMIEQDPGDRNCKNGVIVSLFDITARNRSPESKVLKISYTMPTHCSCPVLQEGGHVVLLLEEPTNVTEELSVNLSQGKYLYATPLKTSFPSCILEDSLQPRSREIENVITVDSPYEKLSKIIPDLSGQVCPTIDHTCPICKSMDDKELQNLYCSSEEVLLVSRSKSEKEDSRKLGRIKKATFKQHIAAGNYTLEMSIAKHEGVCSLPLDAGNCDESFYRYYYDAENEMCSEFTYKGCGGNANNFHSQSECEKDCLVEDFCEEGAFEIKRVMKSSDNANYLGDKFPYALPEHCNCSQMLKGEKKSYLLTTQSDAISFSTQLSRSFHIIPLSKNQRKIQFDCLKVGNEEIGENDLSDKAEKKTEVPVNSEKKKGFSFFG